MRPAVPDYIPHVDLKYAPPGHRFRLYFPGWDVKKGGIDDGKWVIAEDTKDGKQGKHAALRIAADLTHEYKELMQFLGDRQLLVASRRSDGVLVQAGLTEAPFVTGMGMEHPLENGFAFLDPYGLPYLPGSSVKGVMRRAAEELALFDSEGSGWSLLDVWWLFGFDENSAFFHDDKSADPDTLKAERRRWRDAYRQAAKRHAPEDIERFFAAALQARRGRDRQDPEKFLEKLLDDKPLRRTVHLRGSLSFWDVFPCPQNSKLRVDIMNPHHGDYYQKGTPPGDWENPVPIFFLAMDRGTKFRFIVTMEPVAALPERYRHNWKSLMEKAFSHAFSWLGFGAKTSLGYGLMAVDPHDAKYRAELAERKKKEQEVLQRSEEEERQRQRIASMTPFEKLLHELEHDAGLNLVDQVYREQLESVSGEDKKRLAAALKKAYIRHQKWDGKQSEKQKAKNKKLREILEEAP